VLVCAVSLGVARSLVLVRAATPCWPSVAAGALAVGQSTRADGRGRRRPGELEIGEGKRGRERLLGAWEGIRFRSRLVSWAWARMTTADCRLPDWGDIGLAFMFGYPWVTRG
jgi:hypothetical protein